ncbi:DUF3783 domain-containing protein [Clostridium sp. NSJ-6]|uniref:DUF3783 domain-containing protein n=1 Tax=Clostridium hominis TaxID=2763036 RepID=A0ABR7DAZ0_9CLOT|nr:DUF3783 domain-containing protein [Clostridium hominis]MBC5628310.1 DUF3783 domain-containing protein [Clostridium hominis]MDU2670999.1 DUF3783 domain-containing protein [Clostridium sp.]
MSFERLDRNNVLENDVRSCVLLCNFNGKELKAVKNYASILGLRDQICLYSKNGDSTIKDILEDNIDSNCEEGRKERAIIFNNISNMKINMFIDNLKKIRINNILKAVVTETSINWTVNEVIVNLLNERAAINSGNFSDLHKK